MLSDKLIKENALNLVRHHKEHCDGETCNISLSLVAILLRRAGITLTPEEQSECL